MASTLPQQHRDEDMDEENVILLSSESHAVLFYHDEEIMRNSRDHINIANQQIGLLEERLRSSNEENESARVLLYESENARQNEVQSRMSFQRHLRLEQHMHQECVKAYQSTWQELSQTRSEIAAMAMFNEMLRQEVEHSQNVIESMATKLLRYENAAEEVLESMKERCEVLGGLLVEQDDFHEMSTTSHEPGGPTCLTEEPDQSVRPQAGAVSPKSQLVIVEEIPPFPVIYERVDKRVNRSRQGKQQSGGTKTRKSKDPIKTEDI